MSLPVSSCPIEENVHSDKRVGYSGYGTNMDDISCYYGDGRKNIVYDDGENMDDRSVDYGRCVSRYKEISHYSSRNIKETVDGDCRGVYRSHNRHYSSHNPGEHDRLLRISADYIRVDDSLHGNIPGEIRGGYGRHGSRSQETSHSSFHNDVESVDGDWEKWI